MTKPTITPRRIPLPLKDVRQRLGGLAMRTVYGMFERGELQSITIGRRRFVMSDELDRFIEGRIEAAKV